MAKDTTSHVSAEELEKLQTEINNIADKSGELRETVANAISAVGEEWQDSKFDEFSEEYESNKKAMEDISTEYHRYANEILPPIIEKAKEYELLKTSA